MKKIPLYSRSRRLGPARPLSTPETDPAEPAAIGRDGDFIETAGASSHPGEPPGAGREQADAASVSGTSSGSGRQFGRTGAAYAPLGIDVDEAWSGARRPGGKKAGSAGPSPVPASWQNRSRTGEGGSSSEAHGQGNRLPPGQQPQQPDGPVRRNKFASVMRQLGRRLKQQLRARERLVLIVGSSAATLLVLLSWLHWQPQAQALTQADIDKAVFHTLSNKVLPSPETRAFQQISRSVVRVRQLDVKDNSKVRGVGTGVVVVDKGTILTSLHVVAGADKIEIEFADGLVTTATVIGAQPENDLAVLQASAIPDDLQAATLRSTKELRPGDQVIAVGFPFGIGPSVSSGIVSGLRREYQGQTGKRPLSNLIQFDAAVNPGNSGGPLVTMDGAVVGIVTAILNPSAERVFIGIGFAVPIENAASAIGMSPF
ncbi:MAG: trypsin-like peptidase domain-containing protein [Janthinobacterium lividum]